MLKKISFSFSFCSVPGCPCGFSLPHWRLPRSSPPATSPPPAQTAAIAAARASPCATIQYAHNQAAAGDAIQIAAGTYISHAILNRSITLQGADARQPFWTAMATKAPYSYLTQPVRSPFAISPSAMAVRMASQAVAQPSLKKRSSVTTIRRQAIMAAACVCGDQPPFATPASTPTAGCMVAA